MSYCSIALRLLCALATVIGPLGACRHSQHTDKAIGGAELSKSAPQGASIAGFSFGAVTPNLKLRPHVKPSVSPTARISAARNEFEPFQVAFHSADASIRGVSVVLTQPLTHRTSGAKIPPQNLTLYRVGHYDVGVPSNSEGAAGLWPDPLIPDIDTYAGERRNAFPFDVARGETQAVWVDVLVPLDATPGDYRAELEIQVAGLRRGTVPIELHVGNFALPSTASLKSAFGMDYAQPCMAHTDTDSCDEDWNERKACRLRERYIRAGLDHRFTINDVTFQPPFGDSAEPFEELIVPLVIGKGRTRLRGARTTTVRIDDQPDQAARWLTYAQKLGFAEQLFYFPVDEPNNDASQWTQFREIADKLHGLQPRPRLIMTATIKQAQRFKAAQKVDVFVPLIGALDSHGDDPVGSHRAKYDEWARSQPRRALWGYQSCMSHGCGKCGETSPSDEDTGWPSRVIDSSAVQNRAFPWLAFIHRLEGELYFQVTDQLATAWEPNGQCKYSGSGDGTIFYPGKPSIIGGKTDIPVESIRMKLIREGMEDYEYLRLVASTKPEAARSIASELFPRAFQCAQPARKLESARAKLFALLDV